MEMPPKTRAKASGKKPAKKMANKPAKKTTAKRGPPAISKSVHKRKPSMPSKKVRRISFNAPTFEQKISLWTACKPAPLSDEEHIFEVIDTQLSLLSDKGFLYFTKDETPEVTEADFLKLNSIRKAWVKDFEQMEAAIAAGKDCKHFRNKILSKRNAVERITSKYE
jgi:hypothetical protein